MARLSLIVALLALSLGAALPGCAGPEQARARQAAAEAAMSGEDEAACRPKGAPGSPAYDDCRKALASARAQQGVIQEQKRRDFDRVLGAGTSGPGDNY